MYTSCRLEGFINARKKTSIAGTTTGYGAGQKLLRRGVRTVRVRVFIFYFEFCCRHEFLQKFHTDIAYRFANRLEKTILPSILFYSKNKYKVNQSISVALWLFSYVRCGNSNFKLF